jgi:inositol transport system ATP-binding protein
VNEATLDEQRRLGGGRNPVVQMRRICKSFSGVRVLNGVELDLRAAEVHALTGENGAGKSTLMKILAGLLAADSGEVLVKGFVVEPGNTHAALKAGVAMIYQELLPFPDLTVAENIFIGQEPASGILRWIDKAAMRRRAGDLLERLGVGILPTRLMRELRIAEMQTVEIAKALAHRAEVIIMDEPTSALSERETEALFRIIGDLQAQGTAIVYVSHKLDEVFRIADRVTVLRDGFLVATRPAAELTPESLIALMVGREIQMQAPVAGERGGDIVLSVQGLGRAGRFQNVSFDIRRGEIIGLAGLMGAGRTDVLNAIYGLEPADRGRVRVNGKIVRIRKPADALAAGVGLVTEDRKVFGLVPTLDVKGNLTLSALRRWCRAGVIGHAAERTAANEQMQVLGIRAAGLSQSVEHLSGGNQQKVVLARTLLSAPEVLLLDEPTRGIDVAAKAEVHALVKQLAAAGKAVLLVSSELPELLSLSHRILVLREGQIIAEVETNRTSPEEIMKFAIPA